MKTTYQSNIAPLLTGILLLIVSQVSVAETQLEQPAKPEVFDVSNYLPLVKVQPKYPRKALIRGISGWVTLKFDVTAKGKVSNVEVVENCGWVNDGSSAGPCTNQPNDVFDKAAIKAVSKFKYSPRLVNDEPVVTKGVMNMLTFDVM